MLKKQPIEYESNIALVFNHVLIKGSTMKNNKLLATVTLLLSLMVILGVTQKSLQNAVTAASDERMVPHFEVDPFWPQPLPNKWILGSTIGVAVDARDHVYIVHRNDDGNFATTVTNSLATKYGQNDDASFNTVSGSYSR